MRRIKNTTLLLALQFACSPVDDPLAATGGASSGFGGGGTDGPVETGGTSQSGGTTPIGASGGSPQAGIGGASASGGSAGTGGNPAAGGTTSSGGSNNPSEPAPVPAVVGRPVGFAGENGGTTGGAAGAVVTVSTFAQLLEYAESATPYTIVVEGTISNGSSGGRVRVGSNKSIIGLGDDALLSGIGLSIQSSSNVILQNLRMTLVGTSTPSGVNGGDVIAIAGTSRNIWIDHCEIFSEDPAVQTNIDKYDGLVDIRDQTGFITLSWNYLHDHHKGGLVGASDTDLFADRKVTFHHNRYEKVRLRVPMFRGSVGHFFNNLVLGARDATELRAGTCVRVERNYYGPLNFSIYTPSDSRGNAERLDNVEVERAARAYPANCAANIPYSYSSALTANANDVPAIVTAGAGVGKL